MPRRTAAPKDRKYLEGLNLKALQKNRKPDEDPKAFYQGLQEDAKSGPLFNKDILQDVEQLPELPKPLTKWLANLTGDELAGMSPTDLNRLITWVNQSPSAGARLPKLTWEGAIDAADDWATHGDETQGEFEKNKIVYRYNDGWRVVELETENDITREGELVQNCLRDPKHSWYDRVAVGSTVLYSLRTPNNDPRVDIEVTDGKVVQCYGKQNDTPHEKYNKYLVEFFVKMNLIEGIKFLDGDFSNANLDATTWLAIYKSYPKWQKSYFAHNRNMPAEVYDVLAKDYNRDVRSAVASNPSISPKAAAILAQDSDTTVVIDLARNPKIPPTVMVYLARSKYALVRMEMARNKSTPTEILNKLAEDPNEHVADSAKRSLQSR